MEPEQQEHWLERLRTLGRAQARYLWLLVVVGVFYLAVQAQVESGTVGTETLRVPVVGLPISAPVVWATGPVLLAFRS